MDDLSTLRSAIDDSLRQTDAYQQVRDLLMNHAQSSSLSGEISERAALEQLLVKSLPITGTTPPLAPPQPTIILNNNNGSSKSLSSDFQLHVIIHETQGLESGFLLSDSVGGIQW
eukprot:CAMPEP_0114361300 /NCGR_PEP_ID=MMETSP0101-20121206/24609_1 /TAXON_ID=38822 ORGANISM="Pteridomonas danica, Strain PT" /NCGR_SAMPLE_ID=MMETSP0101 /ASSEMBLY_ACC=CAM_ASM_000211 /LENGTH=114 /DNA_ID=CAMNT_0001506165 /DNA_START=17 /DNA_END=358 /DNA_ORIENTATION=-